MTMQNENVNVMQRKITVAGDTTGGATDVN